MIVDDDDRIRDLLRQYLSRQGFLISAAANAAQARKKMQGLQFDLLILDVMMPGEDGFSLTQSLRKVDDVPIILLTARGEAKDRITGLRYGADDYLSKPFEPEELLLRIAAVLKRRGAARTQDELRFGPWHLDIGARRLSRGDDLYSLTSGEMALLMTLARKAGEVVSREALAERIGSRTIRAVDVQMTRLRRKIEENPSEPLYLITERGRGYRLQAEHSP